MYLRSISTISLAVLALTGCTSMMTPEQHHIFAKDLVTLDLCSQAGLIPYDLAAEAENLYVFRLSNYKFKEDVMDNYINQYHQKIYKNVNPKLCNSYATQVYQEILQRKKAQQSAAQLSQAITNMGNAYANSNYQSAQMYNNATQNIYNAPQIQPIQPIQQMYPVRQSQTTNCMTVGSGMYSCKTR